MPQMALELTTQIRSLRNSRELSKAQLSFLLQSDDLRLVQHAVALFVRDRNPEPDALQEHGLRLELMERPHDLKLCYSLIALLLRTGRPPLPSMAVKRSNPAYDLVGLEELLKMGAEYARAGETLYLYATLWQACVRYPHAMRGWAEFARALADRGEWDSCKIAAQHVLDSDAGDEPTVIATLMALSALAANGKIDSLGWAAWVEQLPPPLNSHPLIAKIHLSVGYRVKAFSFLRDTMRAWPNEPETAMVASVNACEIDQPQLAYDYIRRAFELDPMAALRAFVEDFGWRFANIVYGLNKQDELAEYISGLSDRYENLNVIPHRSTPESKLLMQRARLSALDRGLPSVFLVTQGQCASVSVGRIFCSGFELPSILYSLVGLRVISPWLQDYLRGGACYVTHLTSSPRNVELLAAGGVKRVIVHTRDPRQWVISATEHARVYASSAPPAVRERRAAGLSSGLNFTIESLPLIIGWIKGWIKARESLMVDFTTFEEFVRDRDKFLDRILSLYGGDIRYFDRKKAFQEQAGIDYHRRAGRTDEWRAVLTRKQIQRINDLIPNDFWHLFGWQP